MTREELEHAIRAVCDLTKDTAVIVFGSQAILGQYPDVPDALRQSAEADIAPRNAIDKVDLIDAVLGEDSPFHDKDRDFVRVLLAGRLVKPRMLLLRLRLLPRDCAFRERLVEWVKRTVKELDQVR